MATQAWPAQGVTIGINETPGNTNAGSFSLINEVISIENAGGGTVAAADTTWLSSLVKTYRGTIPDNAEVSMSLNFDPTDTVHKFVRNLKDTPSNGPNFFLVTFNTGNTNSSAMFNGIVTEFSGPTAGGVEENLTADVTVKITGAVTWVNAT
jgi:hypothetical protein